jgi:hypothetical protein
MTPSPFRQPQANTASTTKQFEYIRIAATFFDPFRRWWHAVFRGRPHLITFFTASPIPGSLFLFLFYVAIMFVFASSRSSWYLSFAIFTFVLLLYVTLGQQFTGWKSPTGPDHLRTSHALDAFFSPETVDTLYEDARRHRTLLSITEAVARASMDLGEEHGSEGLKRLGKNFKEKSTRMKRMEMPEKRKDTTNNANTGQLQQSGLLGTLKALLVGNSTVGFDSFFEGLGDRLTSELATAALFLGTGLRCVHSLRLQLNENTELMCVVWGLREV